jgi:hypothetical protein
MATIPLDEIAPGATIRYTVIDGVQYLSIRDFIMHACGTSNDYAGDFLTSNEVQTKFEIFSRTSDQVRDFFPNLKH